MMIAEPEVLRQCRCTHVTGAGHNQAIQQPQMESGPSRINNTAVFDAGPDPIMTRHLGPLMMNTGLPSADSGYGPSIGSVMFPYAPPPTTSVGVPSVTVVHAGSLANQEVLDGIFGQAPGGFSAEIPVGEHLNAEFSASDGMNRAGASGAGFAMSTAHLQGVLHHPLPDFHRHRFVAVDDGQEHGMIPVGNYSCVQAATAARYVRTHDRNAREVEQGSSGNMLHVPDQQALIPINENPGVSQSDSDWLEYLIVGEI
jgi:hypothetical protein